MSRRHDGIGRVGRGAVGRGGAERSTRVARRGRGREGPSARQALPGGARPRRRRGSDSRASVKGGRVRRGRRAWPGGARLRQVGPTRTAGPGRGRHEVAEGLGWSGVGDGMRGETVPTRAAGWGSAEAGGARSSGRREAEARRGWVKVGQVWPAGHGRGRAGVAGVWGAGSRGSWCMGRVGSSGEQAAGHRRAGKNKKNVRDSQIRRLCSSDGPRNIRTDLMFLSFLTWPWNISCYVSQRSDVAEEHNDPPYIPRSG
jgi:hypothetical protein